jgi:hypothetical protein
MSELPDDEERIVTRYRYATVVAISLAASVLAGCGGDDSSAKQSSSSTLSSTSTTAATAGTATTSASATTSTTSTGSAAPLPDPCTLLTVPDVAPLFDTTELQSNSGQAGGSARCIYSLKVGTQGLGVGIRTINDFANNAAYVFPSEKTTAAPGLGDQAVIRTANTAERQISVKTGKNVIEITVDFYTKPVDDAFVTKLAKTALSRI